MRRSFVALFAIVVALSTLSGIVAAETLAGGTVTVAEDEELTGDVSATGGTVVVRGTVDGNLRVYGGDVEIADSAEVTGILRVYGGDVWVNGTIGGNALVYGGDVTLGEAGSVDRSFGAVASDVTIAGTVGGDANVLASAVTLAETATVEGGLTYQGELTDEGGTVAGVTQRTQDLALVPPLAPILGAISILMFFADLLLGALLLYAAPQFAEAATRTVLGEPLRTATAGVLALLGVAVVAGLLALTVVGLPLAVAVLLLGVVLAWVAAVYGRYVVGAWLCSHTDFQSRYVALLVGAVVVGLVGLVPYLGVVVRAVVFLLGAGVVTLGARRLYEVVSRNRGGLAEI